MGEFLNEVAALKQKGYFCSLLYVEDDDDVRELNFATFKKIFENADCAKDGEEGLAKFREKHHEIVVADIRMPKMSGLELFSIIKKEAPHTKLVLLSAYAETSFFQKAIEIGVDAYLLKPVSLGGITKVFCRILDSLVMKKELEEQKNLLLNDVRLNALRELLKQVAHHWRNPLAKISLIASLIDEEAARDEPDIKEIAKYSHDIIYATEALSESIGRFASVYYAEQFKKRVDISALLADTFKLVAGGFEEDVKLILSCNEQVFCNTYASDLQQVVMELIANAKRKLLKKGSGKIYLSCSQDTQKVYIKVFDNGGAIDKGIEHRIFDPYFTTETAPFKEGVGLYLSKTIVEEKLEGGLSVKSILDFEHQSGVEFIVSLPIN